MSKQKCCADLFILSRDAMLCVLNILVNKLFMFCSRRDASRLYVATNVYKTNNQLNIPMLVIPFHSSYHYPKKKQETNSFILSISCLYKLSYPHDSRCIPHDSRCILTTHAVFVFSCLLPPVSYLLYLQSQLPSACKRCRRVINT